MKRQLKYSTPPQAKAACCLTTIFLLTFTVLPSTRSTMGKLPCSVEDMTSYYNAVGPTTYGSTCMRTLCKQAPERFWLLLTHFRCRQTNVGGDGVKSRNRLIANLRESFVIVAAPCEKFVVVHKQVSRFDSIPSNIGLLEPQKR